MQKARLIVLTILSCFIASAHAQPVWIEGTLDCGQWTEARKQNRAMTIEAYLVGFLSGVASGSKKEFWRAKGGQTSRQAVYAWMDNYCQADPLENVIFAAIRLFNERVEAPK